MKKFLSITIALLMIFAISAPVFAASDTTVFVTICDKDGKLALANEEIKVIDADGDGALTFNDALICAHDAKYSGGAAAGYTTIQTAYGISMSKLWGAENGSGFGYYLNNASAWNLTDPVKSGDLVNAFIYTDTTTWSDTFCYFDKSSASISKGEELTLTLVAAGYDANFAPVTIPVAGATITVDGKATDYKTDAEGKVTIKLEDAKKHVVSATSETMTLVAPVCTVSVANAGSNPETGDCLLNYFAVMTACLAIICVAVKFKKSYEK